MYQSDHRLINPNDLSQYENHNLKYKENFAKLWVGYLNSIYIQLPLFGVTSCLNIAFTNSLCTFELRTIKFVFRF